MDVSAERAQELLVWLFATSASNTDDSEFSCGVHSGISIALAAVTDGIPENVTSIDPNMLIKRGHDIFSAYADKQLVDYLEEKFAMESPT